jgi:hypothetical protein
LLDQISADEKMSTIFFIANAAGLLGLVIGPSLVSFFEVSITKLSQKARSFYNIFTFKKRVYFWALGCNKVMEALR